MSSRAIIERRFETPAPTTQDKSGSHRLPESLVSEHVQRLAVSAVVGGGLWAYGLAMDTIVRPLTTHEIIPVFHPIAEVLGILTSAVMFLYVRYAPKSPQQQVDAGLVYFVMNAVAVSAFNTLTPVKPIETMGLSWNVVVILISSMILPASPRKMLTASLLAASMDPLFVWFAHLRGIQVPSIVDTFVLFMPNYACAMVATLPPRILLHLGRRLRQAQEMGSYQLLELLGRGGMGEVWRGRHHLLARDSAIKLVRPELLGASNAAESQSMLCRFEREARATAALTSQHTIRVFDYGVTADHTFYYVMELLSGRDLESLVRAFGPLPAHRALFLLKQVCHSLADAHSRGLVHRDVTPSNVYVCRMGLDYDFVKVLDFGLVTFNDRSLEHTMLTGAHTTTGTPAFMAPEIILEGDVDERADVYAFGCVAYFMLTGHLVFEADTPMKMFVQHMQAQPVRPSERSELPIPRDLDDLVMACLEKDPDRRPQDARELLARLGEVRGGENWNNDRARVWWERHLLELTAPLSVPETLSSDCGCPERASVVERRA